MHARPVNSAAICLVLVALSANAQEVTYDFNLAPQPVSQVLAALAKQTGLQVSHPRGALAGVQSPGIKGRYTLKEAVAWVLTGTGFTFEFTGEKAVRIQSAKTDAGKVVEVVGELDRGYRVKAATTATKTDTPLLETPFSVQVVPQQVLVDQKVLILDQALVNVSGVRSVNSGGIGEYVYLRGFPTSLTFRNGFRMEDDIGSGMRSMANVGNVEVLKGPGAILYGRVEPGGIVNLVTKKPEVVPSYSVEQLAGSWDHYQTSLGATGPVNESKTLLYRFDASFSNSHSWRDGITDEKLFLAPTIQWRPSAQTQATLEVEYTHNPTVFDNGKLVPFDTNSNQFVWVPPHINPAVAKPNQNETWFVAFNWSHQFNDDWAIQHQIINHFVHIKPEPYYQVAGYNQVGDGWTVDRYLTMTEGRFTTTATILDLTGHFETAGVRHTLLVGSDVYRRTGPQGSYYSPTDGNYSTTDAFHPAPPTGLVPDPTIFYASDYVSKNYGLYIQDQVKFPFGVQVLAGLRQQKVDRTGSSTLPEAFGGTGTPTPDDPQSDKALTPRFGIVWQPQAWLSLYGNYAENFGANTGRDWQHNPLKPEGAQQKEVGAKAEFFGGKLQTSLAIFDLTKQNVAVADLQHIGFSIAIGEIRSRGTEFDLQGELRPGWNVILTHTYTDIRITKSTPDSAYVQGNRMPNVPRQMASLWSTYDFGLKTSRKWKIGGGLTWRDSATNDTNLIDTPGYTLANAMASYEFKLKGFRAMAQINVSNALNRNVVFDRTAYGSVGYVNYVDPRSGNVSLRVDF